MTPMPMTPMPRYTKPRARFLRGLPRFTFCFVCTLITAALALAVFAAQRGVLSA